MLELPKPIELVFQSEIEEKAIPKQIWCYYKKWLRYYLDFCSKYGFVSDDLESLEAFTRKLAEKRQDPFKQKQAAEAVRIYWAASQKLKNRGEAKLDPNDEGWDQSLVELGNCIKTLQYSRNTLKTYVNWVQEFRRFAKDLPFEDVDASDAARFFTFLATERRVAASTQNQAFNALLFFFKHVLKKEFEGFEGVVRAKQSKYIPVVLTREEVDRVIGQLKHPYKLMAQMLYGCGLRRFEVANLRVQYLNFDTGIVTIHDGKGKKDRAVPLPQVLAPELKRQVSRVANLLRRDLEEGFDGVFISGASNRKYKTAAKQLPWQWVFPARNLTLVPETEELRRYHAHESKLGSVIRAAAHKAQITKRVTAHTFRHSYASHLLQANYDIRTIQQLLGHANVNTTMIYTHTVPSKTLKEAKSPLDF